jgi:hypothetical protein
MLAAVSRPSQPCERHERHECGPCHERRLVEPQISGLRSRCQGRNLNCLVKGQKELPEWDTLSFEEKKLFTKQADVYGV